MNKNNTHTHANIDKFKDGRLLANKRRATSWIYDGAVPKLLEVVRPDDLKAFIMPSSTMHDIKQLRRHGIPDENMTLCERDRSTHAMLRKQTKCDMFNNPTDLSTQIALLGPNDNFHFVYFDMLGAISADLYMVMESAINHAPDHFVLVITVSGARENKYDTKFLEEMSEHFGIARNESRRSSVLNKMLDVVGGDKKIQHRWESEYKADTSGRTMYCYGAYYVN